MNFKILILSLLVLFPFAAFAHGEEVLVSFFYDLLTIVALIIFIALIKWESRGKTLLGLVLIISVITVFSITARWPYDVNRRLIEILCIGVPLLSVLSCYFIFRRRFSVKRKKEI